MDLKIPSELQKALGSHRWQLEHFDQFGQDGIIARYRCSTCEKEWTTLLINPGNVGKKH